MEGLDKDKVYEAIRQGVRDAIVCMFVEKSEYADGSVGAIGRDKMARLLRGAIADGLERASKSKEWPLTFRKK